MATPAFWTGLLYSESSCRAAWDLVGGKSLDDHLRAIDDVAHRGFDAVLGTENVGELAAELLRLAEAGLQERISAGVEAPEVLDHLDPLNAVVRSGETFAHQQLRRWEGEFQHDPSRYVGAFRIPD